MTFSDSDWTRDPPARPRLPPAQRRVLILATAIAVSCVALAVALYGIEQMLDASARSAAPEPISEALRKAPPGAGVAQPPETPAASAASPAGTSAAPAWPASAASAPDAQPLAAQQAAAEAARRKERTWQRFYQRPDFCADNPTAAQMVQCANHHIRARKEFEERYAAGRL
jgi:type IV secretory pathway VirB10-like protein